MSVAISLPAQTFVNVQVPARVGAKTIMLNVNYVGCNVSIGRTNEHYYHVVARQGLRGMATITCAVWFDQNRGVWVGDYFDHVTGGPCQIGQSKDLNEMLFAAQNNVSWRGHELGTW